MFPDRLSDTQGLPPRYADRGSADESRERGRRGAHRRADAARLHARSKLDIRSPWCGGQIEPNAATVSYPAAVIAKSSGIPAVIATGSGDPVASGLVASLARPGGNVTGLSDVATTLSTKRLSLL